MAEGQGSAIITKLIAKAKKGDIRAIEIVATRIWPARKSRQVQFKLPAIENVSDILSAHTAVISAVADGELTPDEGAILSTLLNNKRETITAVDFEQRLAALEAGRSEKAGS
jgi:hypothetical protein